MNWVWHVTGALVILIAGLAGWRAFDHHADQSAWARLIKTGANKAQTYDLALVADLPEPARRYFNYTIQPGAPLYSVVEIDMKGELGLGSMEEPNYRPMQARQVLAPPYGLVWKLKTGPISGSDGAMPERSWTRFWLFGLVPIVRAGGADHQRSAFGRVVIEGAAWVPASLLPGNCVRWESIDANSARAIVRYGAFEQAVDILVDEMGAPRRVAIRRWSNGNPEQEFREQPFGGYLSEFKDFDGYKLPTHIEVGNHIGTPDYFPFLKAEITAFRFPARDQG